MIKKKYTHYEDKQTDRKSIRTRVLTTDNERTRALTTEYTDTRNKSIGSHRHLCHGTDINALTVKLETNRKQKALGPPQREVLDR
jgi:hypothetical protein